MTAEETGTAAGVSSGERETPGTWDEPEQRIQSAVMFLSWLPLPGTLHMAGRWVNGGQCLLDTQVCGLSWTVWSECAHGKGIDLVKSWHLIPETGKSQVHGEEVE